MSVIETYAEKWGRHTGLNGFRTIDYCNGASGYEWDEFHVLRGPDGLLYVGHSENFTESRDLFRLRGKTIYEKV